MVVCVLCNIMRLLAQVFPNRMLRLEDTVRPPDALSIDQRVCVCVRTLPSMAPMMGGPWHWSRLSWLAGWLRSMFLIISKNAATLFFSKRPSNTQTHTHQQLVLYQWSAPLTNNCNSSITWEINSQRKYKSLITEHEKHNLAFSLLRRHIHTYAKSQTLKHTYMNH